MSAWSLLIVPLSLSAVIGILFGIAWFEQRVLSSAALIRYTARSRRIEADAVEVLVARQSEPLLRNIGRS